MVIESKTQLHIVRLQGNTAPTTTSPCTLTSPLGLQRRLRSLKIWPRRPRTWTYSRIRTLPPSLVLQVQEMRAQRHNSLTIILSRPSLRQKHRRIIKPQRLQCCVGQETRAGRNVHRSLQRSLFDCITPDFPKPVIWQLRPIPSLREDSRLHTQVRRA